MVEKLRTIVIALKKDNKPFWIFAILKMDELIDKWSLVVAAPWITPENHNEIFGLILNQIKNSLEPSELATIARLSLLNKNDHLIEELLKRASGTEIREEKINGNIVHQGTIIESNSDLVWQAGSNLL
jgi:hypothetical protein